MDKPAFDPRAKEARRIARRYAHEAVSADDRRYLEAYAAGEDMTGA